jgi:ADP-L-glycero-D-manno-heptose 6-epimerase
MIIVTGGAGFIGSVLVKELNNSGREDILIVDRLESDEKWKNLRNLSFIDYVQADEFIINEDERFWQDVDVIYHMGACSATTETDVDYLWENNVRYSQQLIAHALDFDIPIVYASSAATYGGGEAGYSDSHDDVKRLSPLNPYGYSKHYTDQWLLGLSEQPKQWYGVKFFNVFGPNEYHKDDMRSLVHKAFGQINETGKVKLFKSHKDGFKDGEQLRDFVYVRDVVKAMIGLVDTNATNGLYNLGTGHARSFYDLVSATFKALGKEVNVEFVDMPLSIRDQYQYFTQADMSKFKKALPDFSFMKLEDAVEDYVKSYLLSESGSFY